MFNKGNGPMIKCCSRKVRKVDECQVVVLIFSMDPNIKMWHKNTISIPVRIVIIELFCCAATTEPGKGGHFWVVDWSSHLQWTV